MLHAQAKPPAYLISAVMIIDPAGYKEYADKFAPTQVHSPRRSDRCPSGCGRTPRSAEKAHRGRLNGCLRRNSTSCIDLAVRPCCGTCANTKKINSNVEAIAVRRHDALDLVP
jgi:hypothetical protein